MEIQLCCAARKSNAARMSRWPPRAETVSCCPLVCGMAGSFDGQARRTRERRFSRARRDTAAGRRPSRARTAPRGSAVPGVISVPRMFAFDSEVDRSSRVGSRSIRRYLVIGPTFGSMPRKYTGRDPGVRRTAPVPRARSPATGSPRSAQNTSIAATFRAACPRPPPGLARALPSASAMCVQTLGHVVVLPERKPEKHSSAARRRRAPARSPSAGFRSGAAASSAVVAASHTRSSEPRRLGTGCSSSGAACRSSSGDARSADPADAARRDVLEVSRDQPDSATDVGRRSPRESDPAGRVASHPLTHSGNAVPELITRPDPIEQTASGAGAASGRERAVPSSTDSASARRECRHTTPVAPLHRDPRADG